MSHYRHLDAMSATIVVTPTRCSIVNTLIVQDMSMIRMGLQHAPNIKQKIYLKRSVSINVVNLSRTTFQ